MRIHRFAAFVVGAALLILTSVRNSHAQAANDGVRLPPGPSAWINSPPLSKENLAGKGVFLWFFEESCPRCREKWPTLMAIAQKFRGKPVLFVAVNSGTPRPALEQYVRANGVDWPVIVDEDRQFETACRVGQISLQNIHHVRLLMADGSLRFGDWTDLEGSAEQALKGAAWKVDPADLPESLRPAWQAVELGHYAAAAASLKRGLANSRPEVKQAAEKLQVFVRKEIDQRLARAKTAEEAGDEWTAYKTYVALSDEFKGFDLPPSVAGRTKQLAGDRAVTSELAAMRNLETARKLLASPVSQKRGVILLERLAKESPQTEAGREAQTLLQRAAP